LAEEARELGSSANFPPAVVSAGVDLLFNFVRRGEVGRAEGLFHEVQSAADSKLSSHLWLWRIRLAEVWAELVFTRGDSSQALQCADEAIAKSRASGRLKYEVLGLLTRGRALQGLGRTREAIADLRHAIGVTRPVGDPAMFLRVATALLAIEGDDALLAETRATAQRMSAALPDEAMRQRFLQAEPVRTLAKLSG
jgi:tetratricopeptide (TPR) repeat protein